MHYSMQNTKIVGITPPAAIVDNAAVTTASIDTKGWGYMTVYVYLGASDIAVSALKLQESDTDGSYADVTGLVFGTSTNIDGSTSAVPSSTDDNKFFAFDVNLVGRKRYFDLVLTGGDGSSGAYFTAWAILSRPKDSPVTAAERGCDEILRV